MEDYILEDDSGLLIDYIPAEQAVLKDVPYWFFDKTYEVKVWNTLGDANYDTYIGHWKTSLKNPEQPNIWVSQDFIRTTINNLKRKFPHSKTTKYELDIEGFIYILYQIQLR